MTDPINPMKQLAQWWEDAEVPTRATLPKDGDRIIIRHNLEWYEIATSDGDAGEDELSADTRVLARAPIPKPAWHDAVAVMARWEDPDEPRECEPYGGETCVFVNYGPDGWTGAYDSPRRADELHDVAPLIEARVTDEMVDRVWRALDPVVNPAITMSAFDRVYVRSILAAALGVDE